MGGGSVPCNDKEVMTEIQVKIYKLPGTEILPSIDVVLDASIVVGFSPPKKNIQVIAKKNYIHWQLYLVRRRTWKWGRVCSALEKHNNQ